MKHALVTGGAGFIGSHLTEALLGRGWRVSVLDDLSTGSRDNLRHLAPGERLRFVEGSVLDRERVERLVEDCDVVVHLAAAVGVERIIDGPVDTIEINVVGTHHVLRAAALRRTRVLLASSSEVYGKSEAVPFPEDGDRILGPTTRLRWSYATSKAVGEHLGLAYHRQAGLPVTVVRPFNTVGPRQSGRYGMVVPRFVRQAVRGEALTVYGDGRQRRSFCDVRDVVAAVVSLLERDDANGEVFNVGSEDEIEILELARLVLRLATGGAADARIELVPYDRAYGPGFEDMRRRQPDTAKLRRLTGWRPRIALEQTVRELIDGEEERA